ncbi:hypothetical protein RvY_16728 [Ramazzottius varieornatus]|uniref:Uncharacterized protein n=1 Tax=Ramazzottius varieornatus TaxID=947166 RepID=A0A1D1W075_RAMVA|nr:hypothetical protein RvY_16728 [Ramazzottius varieornatus]
MYRQTRTCTFRLDLVTEEAPSRLSGQEQIQLLSCAEAGNDESDGKCTAVGKESDCQRTCHTRFSTALTDGAFNQEKTIFQKDTRNFKYIRLSSLRSKFPVALKPRT